MYKTVDEIKNGFINDGWSKNIQFEELTLIDLKKIGVDSMIKKVNSGRKYFKMLFSGNVYDDNGNIALYDIHCKTQ